MYSYSATCSLACPDSPQKVWYAAVDLQIECCSFQIELIFQEFIIPVVFLSCFFGNNTINKKGKISFEQLLCFFKCTELTQMFCVSQELQLYPDTRSNTRCTPCQFLSLLCSQQSNSHSDAHSVPPSCRENRMKKLWVGRKRQLIANYYNWQNRFGFEKFNLIFGSEKEKKRKENINQHLSSPPTHLYFTASSQIPLSFTPSCTGI